VLLQPWLAYPRVMEIHYAWRAEFENAEVNALHAEGFGHRLLDDDWKGKLDRHSLGWVGARDGEELVGFVNVAWDGATHAFIIDTLVAERVRRQGIALSRCAPGPSGGSAPKRLPDEDDGRAACHVTP